MTLKINVNKILLLLMCVLMFLMIYFCSMFSMFKITMVLFILVICLLWKDEGKILIQCDSFIFKWTLAYICLNIIGIVLGLLYGNEGVADLIRVDIVEPMIFLILISNVNEDMYNYLKLSLRFITLFVYIYNIIFFMSANSILLPDSFASLLPLGQLNYGGVMLFSFKPAIGNYVTWFYFLTPLYTAKFIFSIGTKEKERRIILANVILGIINIVITMRTIYIIVFLATLFFSIFLKLKISNLKIRLQKNSYFIIIFLIILIIVNVEKITKVISLLINKVVWSFNINEGYVNEFGLIDNGGVYRANQIKALINTWIKRPIFGWGTAANAEGIIRGGHGLYEMTYFAMLMQKGFVGLFFYAMLIISLFLLIRQVYKDYYRTDMRCVLIALSGMLIANGTNSYIQNFDRLIVLFLPLLIYNLDKRSKIDKCVKKLNR